MKVECSCLTWKKYIPIIKNALDVLQHHPHLWKKYPPNGILFKFCPWCGKDLQTEDDPKQATFTPPIDKVWRGPAGRGEGVT